MEVLTKESLDAAVKKCQENENYQVILVTEYASDHTDIFDYLTQNCDAIIARRKINSYITFPNRSIIRMLSSSSSARGYRADLILCEDKFFNDADIYNRLQAMELPRIKFCNEV